MRSMTLIKNVKCSHLLVLLDFKCSAGRSQHLTVDLEIDSTSLTKVQKTTASIYYSG